MEVEDPARLALKRFSLQLLAERFSSIKRGRYRSFVEGAKKCLALFEPAPGDCCKDGRLFQGEVMTSTADACVAGIVVVSQSIGETGVPDDAVSLAGYEADRGVAHSSCVLIRESEAICS